MKRTKLLIILTLALAQISALLFIAWRWEDVLKTGQQVFWQTTPVDPADAFRGRYIDLNFNNTGTPVTADEQFKSGQIAYAIVSTKDNLAYISGVSTAVPQTELYIKTRINYVNKSTVHFTLPFKRYYLNEHKAPLAETAYRKSADKTGLASVRLKGGLAVIEQLYIDGQALEEYLKTISAK